MAKMGKKYMASVESFVGIIELCLVDSSNCCLVILTSEHLKTPP